MFFLLVVKPNKPIIVMNEYEIDFYHRWLWLLLLLLRLRLALARSVPPIITEPVHPDEAVVENSLCALYSSPGLIWRGKLDQGPLWVILVGHLLNKQKKWYLGDL